MEDQPVKAFRKNEDGTYTCYTIGGAIIADHVVCGECPVKCQGYEKKTCSLYAVKVAETPPRPRKRTEPQETLWDNAKEVEPLEDYGAEKDCEQLDEGRLTKPKTK